MIFQSDDSYPASSIQIVKEFLNCDYQTWILAIYYHWKWHSIYGNSRA